MTPLGQTLAVTAISLALMAVAVVLAWHLLLSLTQTKKGHPVKLQDVPTPKVIEMFHAANAMGPKFLAHAAETGEPAFMFMVLDLAQKRVALERELNKRGIDPIPAQADCDCGRCNMAREATGEREQVQAQADAFNRAAEALAQDGPLAPPPIG